MANEKLGILGRKLGMTQLFEDDGTVVPCTVVEVGPCTVLQIKSTDGRDGYNALKLGFGSQKASRLTKADLGNFKKAGLDKPVRFVKEVRVSKADASKFEVGGSLTVGDVFTAGTHADVIGTSKGCGFAGVMKRYNFAGFERSHGVHEFYRHGGSIGTRLTPGMVLKGKKMPGHMGSAQVTVQNLKVARVDTERNLVYLRGGVPGPNGSMVVVRQAVKS